MSTTSAPCCGRTSAGCPARRARPATPSRGGDQVTHPLTLALVCSAVLAFGFGGPGASDARPPDAVTAGARTNALRPTVRALQREIARLERQVEVMEESAERYEDWQTCLRYV